MQLNPSEISELIKSKIQNLQGASEVRTQGTVVSVTDGICRVHGLQDVMQGEMLEFPGNTFGMALNLERDSVGAVVLGAYEHITGIGSKQHVFIFRILFSKVFDYTSAVITQSGRILKYSFGIKPDTHGAKILFLLTCSSCHVVHKKSPDWIGRGFWVF